MRFSIIVPVYNTEKYLQACVASILEQTFPEFELLLIDDASPDRCPEICDSFARSDAAYVASGCSRSELSVRTKPSATGTVILPSS